MNKLLAALPAGLVLAGLYAPPAAPADARKLVPVFPLAVNTPADEVDPFFASDGLTLYYSSNARGKFDVLVARRARLRDPWRKPEPLEGYVPTPGDDRGVYVTREGDYPQYLYYASMKEKDGTNFDLYVAVKQLPGEDKVFAEPTGVLNVNTEADERDPWLTGDGKELYFSRKTADGWRVFVARRKVARGPQGWDEPALVGEIPPQFHHATLTPDGRTMYLEGPLGKGRWGLFFATRTVKGWGKPEPLSMLNHPGGPTGDHAPSLSRDGTRLYFASDRPGGQGGLDLYVVETASLWR
jgi:hypothetical protein